MNIVMGTSIGGAIMTYEVIAIFGYLTFGSNVNNILLGVIYMLTTCIKVGANVIAMYPSTSLFIAVGQLAIVVLIMFSYPLQVQPCRNCLDKIFHAGNPINVPSDDDDGEVVVDEHAVADMSFLKHTLLTTGIIGFS